MQSSAAQRRKKTQSRTHRMLSATRARRGRYVELFWAAQLQPIAQRRGEAMEAAAEPGHAQPALWLGRRVAYDAAVTLALAAEPWPVPFRPGVCAAAGRTSLCASFTAGGSLRRARPTIIPLTERACTDATDHDCAALCAWCSVVLCTPFPG